MAMVVMATMGLTRHDSQCVHHYCISFSLMFCIAFTPVLKETVVTFLLSFKDGRLKYLKKVSVIFST